MSLPTSRGRRFAALFSRDWIMIMSGIASVLLSLLGAVLSVTLPPWVFWVTGWICLLVCCYRVWLAECRARESDQAEFGRQLAARDQQIRELEDQRDMRLIRSQLGHFIETGNAIRGQMFALEMPLHYFTSMVQHWQETASQFLHNDLGEYAAWFESESGFAVQGVYGGKPQEFSNVVNFLDRRIARLGDILNTISQAAARPGRP